MAKARFYGIDNPARYLKEYMIREFGSMQLNPPRAQRYGKVTKGSVIMRQGNDAYIFSLMLPEKAPHDARPVCHKVIHQDREELLWEYAHDHRPQVCWGEKERVHLGRFESKLVLVHVKEFDPSQVVRVTNIHGTPFQLAVSGLFKVHFAKRWGFKYYLTHEEKQAINKA